MMLKLHFHLLLHLPPISRMQSFRNLLHHKQLLRIQSTSNPQSLSTNLVQRLIFSHRSRYSPRKFIHVGDRSWEEQESKADSRYGCPGEDLDSFASYDPSTDQLEWRAAEESIKETRRYAWKEKDSDGEPSEGEDRPKFWTFYDPLEGKIIMKPVENDEHQKEEQSLVEEVPAETAKSVRKRVVLKPPKQSEQELRVRDMNNRVYVDSLAVARRKLGKVKVSWVCEGCGDTFGQWWGTCPSCSTVGTVKKFSETEVCRKRGDEVSEAVVKRSWLPQQSAAPQSLADVNMGRDQSEWRIPLSGYFGMEVSRVLGGGIVPGSLVLVGGDPGIGKSTLLLQIAAIIAQGLNYKGPAPVLYVSGEESIEQIGNRADRMGITTKDLFLYSSTDVEDILDKIQKLSPQALIVDSIQTVYLRGVTGSAGNIMQVKECTSALLRFAKQTSIPVLLIGHVTKTGDIAGPRILEHIVDAVLYMEGERCSSYRLLRSVKNRFGSTDELGVFEMSESGLQAVSNPSEIFLSEHSSDSEILAGLAIAVIVDGSRTFLIEIQALCVPDSPPIARHINGINQSRSDMIISVLMKQAGLKLQSSSIFLNVVSGVKLTETAGDLAIAAAICSSFLEFPIPNDVAFIGEIGLGGELRTVPRMDKRVLAVAKLGYKKIVIPKAAERLLRALNPEITILGCRNLKEVINTVFQAA